MIKSADEFVRLRTSKIAEERDRVAHDMADISTWIEVIEKYPDYKQWVVHNKTVPVEILEILALDQDPDVRSAAENKNKRHHIQGFIAGRRRKCEVCFDVQHKS